MTSNHQLLYRLAELMLEHEQHILSVDLLFDDVQIGDFVKSIQIDSPYQNLVEQGVLTEIIIDGGLFVTFTLEGFFHYSASEVFAKKINIDGPNLVFEKLYENKLRGISEIYEQLLIKDVIKNDFTKINYLIDNKLDYLSICIFPIIHSFKIYGINETIKNISGQKFFWKVLSLISIKLESLQYKYLQVQFLTEITTDIEPIDTKEKIELLSSAINELDVKTTILDLANRTFSNQYFFQNSESLFSGALFFYKMEEFQKSKELLEKAIEIEKAKTNKDYGSLGSLYIGYGATIMGTGEIRKAIHIFKIGQKFYIKALGRNHHWISKTNFHIGSAFLELGLFKTAHKYYKLSYKFNLQQFGKYHPSTALIFQELGEIFYKKKRFYNAIKYLKHSIIIMKRYFNILNENIVKGYENLSLCYLELKDEQKSISYSLKALKMADNLGLSESFFLRKSNSNIGIILNNFKKNKAALYFYRKSYKIQFNYYKETNIDIASTIIDIGSVYYNMEKYKIALNNFDRANKILQEKNYKGDEYFRLFSWLADTHFKIGNVIEALSFNIWLIRKYKTSGQDKTEIYYERLKKNAIYYMFLNDDNGEIKSLKSCLHCAKIIFGKNHSEISELNFALGCKFQKLKKYENSIRYLKKSYNSLIKNRDNIIESFKISCLDKLTFSFFKLKKFVDALNAIENLIKIKVLVHGENSASVASSLKVKGHIFLQMGKYSESTNAYFESIKIFINANAYNHPEVKSTYNNIAAVLEKMGNHEKAREYYLLAGEIENPGKQPNE